jgi:HSP20 family protein
MGIDLRRTRPSISGQMNRPADRLFEDAFTPFYGGRDGGGTAGEQVGVQTLPVSIWETQDAFQAALMAPGLDENSITVTLQEDTLSIEGELTFQPPEGARLIWQEFAPSRFRRSLRFGTSVDRDRIEAVYRNGLLLITIPKAEEAKPRQVRVQLAEPGPRGGDQRGFGGSSQPSQALTGESATAQQGHPTQPDQSERQ